MTIVALLLVPLALLARRRRWSALVLGGTVAVLGDRALAARLPALLQPRLALAVAAPVRVHPLRRGPRRRLRDHQPLLADARARRRAGVRHLAPGRVRRRLRAARAEDRARDRGLDRALRRHCRARRRRSPRLAARPESRRRPARARATARPRWPSSSSSCPSPSTASRHWTPEVKHDRDALTPGLIHFLQQDVRAALGRLRGPRDELPDRRRSPPSTSSRCRRPTPRTRGRTSSPSAGGRCSGSSRIRASRSRRPGARSGSSSPRSGPVEAIEHDGLRPALRRTAGSSSSGCRTAR